ncbi:DMT superfamily inner membrane transporter protein (plasmid) [Rhizobium etli 8C-3]|uniref:DMT superfamily inner membrane transporter protein n=1 Tax=Rhizobium etli 8C-3 TaxID=538025 RepID=A0A1L5PA67_RHIET|nr:DMT family transporter [Rhizobium etli]APO77087.1 DMT superfamily inner membrane transporter protein [Rhizobium etli 8C-3]
MFKNAKVAAVNLAVANAIFGTIGLFAVEAGLPPFATVFWRCVFATVFLLVWCVGFGHLAPANLSPKLLIYAAIGGIGNIGSSVALFGAYKFSSIATATIIYHVQPFFVVLIGAVALRETIKASEILWIVLAFVGLILSTGLIGTTGGGDGSWVPGVGLSLGAAFLYAVGTIIGKELGAQRPEVTTLVQTIVGALLLSPFADLAASVPVQSWKWLISLGVLHTGIAYVLIFSAYPRLRTPVIGVFAFIFPLVAILVDLLVYDKPIDLLQAAGLLLIMLGTLGVQLGWAGNFRRERAVQGSSNPN